MNDTPEFLSAGYWDNRYRKKETGWDIGYVSTPLQTYIDQLTDKHLRILIPGGGNSYEAIYLAENGFTDITVVDISKVLCDQLRQKFTDVKLPFIQVMNADFFEIGGKYDLVIEQTFFCAINPELRAKYVEKVNALLSGNGKLTGLLFEVDFGKNPPFGGNRVEYRQLFSVGLRIRVLEPCFNSINARSGTELFLIAEKEIEAEIKN